MTFSRAAPVGAFVLGQPFVLSTGPDFAITSLGRASSRAAGNGAMIDPFLVVQQQGFDPLVAFTGENATYAVPYSDSVNADPSVSGPVPVASGSAKSIVKSIRTTGATAGDTAVIARYLPLTVLAARPRVGSFRPGMAGTDKTVTANANDIDLTCFRRLPVVAGFPTVTQALARWSSDAAWFLNRGERLRRLQVYEAATGANYSADYTPLLLDSFVLLHFDVPDADKRALLMPILQNAGDVEAEYRAGFGGSIGAGQHHLYGALLWIAAYALNSQRFYDAALAMQSNSFNQPRWVNPQHIGRQNGDSFPTGDGGANVYRQAFFPTMANSPFWRAEFDSPPEGSDSTVLARYLEVSGQALFHELLPVLLLLPVGTFAAGHDAVLSGGPRDTTNRRAALTPYLDRYFSWTSWRSSGGIPSRMRSFYSATRDLVPVAKWTGVPDQIPYDWTGNDIDRGARMWTAITGGVAYNYSGLTFSTLPVTRRDVRYSYDRFQYVEVLGVAATGQITGLVPGMPVWGGERRVNALGAGEWSPNFPYEAGGQDRGRVIVGGTAPTGTPACSVLPQIMAPRQPDVRDYDYEPVTTLRPDQITLTLGVGGGWSGNISGGFAFQWQIAPAENGPFADITGANAKRYSRNENHPGQWLRGGVTTGGVTVFSLPVQVPPARVLPAGVAMDTHFTAEFQFEYPATFADLNLAANLNDTTAVHARTQIWNSPGATPGGVKWNATADFPRGSLPIHGLTVGRGYLMDADFPINGEARPWTGTGYARIASTPTGPGVNIILPPDGSRPSLAAVRGYPFTATANPMFLYISLDARPTPPGNPAVSYLFIREA